MTDRDVMQQALEALESIGQPMFALAPLQDAANALRARLAEPEPEPLASVNRYCRAGMCVESDKQHEAFCRRHSSHIKQGEPAASPAEPEPEPVAKYRSCSTHCCPIHGCKYGHRGCPVHLGQVKPEYPKNNGCEYCESEPEPEPVGTAGDLFTNTALERLDLRPSTKVYTTPPTRRPLTDEEIWRAFRQSGLGQFHHPDAVVECLYEQCLKAFARAIERARKITGGNNE